jgi:hypothetical protein
MKTQIVIGNHRSKNFLLITLSTLIVALLCSGACVTSSVIEYAKIKASPSNVTEFTIGKVHSAQVQENSDISVLVEFGHPTHPKSGLYTITVPHPTKVENVDAMGSFGFREKYTPSVTDLPTYLYPMGKAKKVKEETVQMKDSPSSPVRIEEMNLHRDETERVLKLVGDMNKDPSGEPKNYTVNLLSGAAEKASKDGSGETVEKTATIEKTILLVQLRAPSSSSDPQTIVIAGAYEDESTNLYYLLVPPAIALDARLIALAIVAQGASSGSLSFH